MNISLKILSFIFDESIELKTTIVKERENINFIFIIKIFLKET
jgi:hypothetical protein